MAIAQYTVGPGDPERITGMEAHIELRERLEIIDPVEALSGAASDAVRVLGAGSLRAASGGLQEFADGIVVNLKTPSLVEQADGLYDSVIS